MRIALTIAGSDSGGGAGIQADLKTFHQFGVFGTSAIVALTAQNTRGVRAVEAVSPAMVTAQIEALAEDLPPNALKTGMLATPELVAQVAAAIRRHGWTRYVLDPVMVATSGDRLLTPEAEATVRDELLPLAMLVTPNLEEAAILAQMPVQHEADMIAAGLRLLELGAGAALIKGGHLPGEILVDILVTESGVERFTHRRIPTTSTHGTGCTLSAAITAGLALAPYAAPMARPISAPSARPLSAPPARPLSAPPARPKELRDAVANAIDFVHRAIAAAPGLGGGHGPVNHGVPARE